MHPIGDHQPCLAQDIALIAVSSFISARSVIFSLEQAHELPSHDRALFPWRLWITGQTHTYIKSGMHDDSALLGE